MPLPTKTTAELNQQAFDYLLTATNGQITMLSPGSTARALVEINNRHLEQFYDTLSLYQSMSYLSTATGVYLDLIGDLFGLTRLSSQAAKVTAEDRSIRFFVTSGTLYDRLPKVGDLNRGAIPAGTSVKSADGSVVYVTDYEVTFPRTATEVFVPATASTTGAGYNVGAHTLRQHSLIPTDVYVTNPISINVGKDTETDEEFRQRISRWVRSSQGANEAAVRLAVLSAPGVADVKIIPFMMGAGSFDVLIVPTGNKVAQETLEVAKQNLADTVAFGMFWRLREPKYVRFSMVISLSIDDGRLAGERDAVRANVERAVLNYLGNIRMGNELIISRLGTVILQADDRVKDYDIQALCINGKPQILHNYRLNQDELFVPDENLIDPVRVI